MEDSHSSSEEQLSTSQQTQTTLQNVTPTQASRISSRLRHAELQPLSTKNLNPVRHRRATPTSNHPRSASIEIPRSSLMYGVPRTPGLQADASHGIYSDRRSFQGPRRPPTYTNVPRRHSAIISPGGGVTSRLGAVALTSPPVHDAAPSPDVSSFHQKSIAAETREMLLMGVRGSELARLGTVASGSRSINSDLNLASRRLSTGCSRADLREWGHVYLNNVATADVFVTALQLSRSSVSVSADVIPEAKNEDISDASTDHDKENKSNTPTVDFAEYVVIKAKVTPKAQERKPFLIQRRFNLLELRGPRARGDQPARPNKDSVTTEEADEMSGREEDPAMKAHQRSHSIPSIPPRAQPQDALPTATPISTSHPSLQSPIYHQYQHQHHYHHQHHHHHHRTMPIHIEYALHYLPVLGALMLSGHIRKGDSVDLPLPHPEAWCDAVAFVYTGRGRCTEEMRRNIVYLAGREE